MVNKFNYVYDFLFCFCRRGDLESIWRIGLKKIANSCSVSSDRRDEQEVELVL